MSISQPNGDVEEHRFNGRKPESIARGPEEFKVLLGVGRELIKRGYTRGRRLIVCQVRPLPVGFDPPIDLIIGPESTAGNEAGGAACKRCRDRAGDNGLLTAGPSRPHWPNRSRR